MTHIVNNHNPVTFIAPARVAFGQGGALFALRMCKVAC